MATCVTAVYSLMCLKAMHFITPSPFRVCLSVLARAAPCPLHAATHDEFRQYEGDDDSGTSEPQQTVVLLFVLLVHCCCCAAVRTVEHTSNYL